MFKYIYISDIDINTFRPSAKANELLVFAALTVDGYPQITYSPSRLTSAVIQLNSHATSYIILDF